MSKKARHITIQNCTFEHNFEESEEAFRLRQDVVQAVQQGFALLRDALDLKLPDTGPMIHIDQDW